MHTYVTAQQAHHIGRRVQTSRLWLAIRHGLRTFLGLVGIGVIAFLIISGPAQWERLQHFFVQLHRETSAAFEQDLSTNQWVSPTRFLTDPTFQTLEVVEAPAIPSGHLVIPTIGVDAPILWDVPLIDSLNGLQEGVVQASESVQPGQIGRTFIIGHSAGYWWNQNPWTKVFALLDQVKDGDLIFLNDGQTAYGYKVVKREVVTPNDVQVVRDDSLDHNQLALMTCTPVGTTLNRLIVYAEPVALR